MRAEQTFAVTTKHDAYQSINRSLIPSHRHHNSLLDRQNKKMNKKKMNTIFVTQQSNTQS